MTEMTWFTDENSTFGDRMAAAREAAGLTQTDLARRTGVRLTSIRSWENDQSEPRANTLQRVSGILGVSLMWLLAGEGEGATEEPVGPSEDMRELLLELRALRGDHARIGERMGRLEKRLRLTMAQTEDA